MGCWALPHSWARAKHLQRICRQALPANVAVDRLYSVYGDDELFDAIDALAVRQPTGDVRGLVIGHLRNLLRRYLKRPSDFRKPFAPEALAILETLVR